MVTRNLIRPINRLVTRTARDFSGGLNTEDSALNLPSKFLIDARNILVTTQGVAHIRYGTHEVARIFDADEQLIACEFFNNAIIAVSRKGKVWRITRGGDVSLLWDEGIAQSRPGSPNGWGTTEYAEFTQFAGELIIVNGIDKPLVVNAFNQVNYLQDLGTGSNVNVPRARHCTTFNDYLVLAGTQFEPDTLFIGAKGTAGTFFGDPPPNDATNFSCSQYVDIGAPVIRAVSSFRDRLLVFFDEQVLIVKLGEYQNNNHVPEVEDRLQGIGALSGRCVVSLGDDVVVLSRLGVESMKRTIITGQFSPKRVSTNIDTTMQRAIRQLNNTAVAHNVFAVHNRIDGHVMFFLPKTNNVMPSTDNNVYTLIKDGVTPADRWGYLDNMPYRAACQSGAGEIFFVEGHTVWRYSNTGNVLFPYRDKALPNEEAWSDGTLFGDGKGWRGTGLTGGTAIPFRLRTPWLDFGNPMQAKCSRYMMLECMAGPPPNTQLTVRMYIDLIEPEALSSTFEVTATPAGPDTNLLGTEANNTVNTESDVPISIGGLGGNVVQADAPTNNMQLYNWPSKFRRASFEFEGNAVTYFALASINVAFIPGGVRR
jgi:hypothetical protein